MTGCDARHQIPVPAAAVKAALSAVPSLARAKAARSSGPDVATVQVVVTQVGLS